MEPSYVISAYHVKANFDNLSRSLRRQKASLGAKLRLGARRNDLSTKSPFITRREYALTARIGLSSVDEGIRRGEIPVVRLGRRVLIPKRALEDLIEAAFSAKRSA